MLVTKIINSSRSHLRCYQWLHITHIYWSDEEHCWNLLIEEEIIAQNGRIFDNHHH